ncbi:MAG: hypothetical protein MUO77_11185, partial [Anaerolineales bacterium]|nr:hypothetical protein [Anaerolineales bacterium]
MQNLKVSIALMLVLLAVSVAPAKAIDFDPPKESHVLGAVVMMYAAMPEEHSAWLEAVCENMTAGGCGYFT